MKSTTRCLALIGLTAAWNTKLAAMPSAEKYNDFISMESGTFDAEHPIFLRDHDDPNVYYAPYDEISVKPKNSASEMPRFGLAYSTQGGLLSFTIHAQYSKPRRQAIQNYIDNEKVVRPLTPISGHWALTVSKGNSDIYIGVPNYPNTVLPDIPVAMSTFLSKQAVGLVVMAYSTGASLGVNYEYKFRAVLTPMRIRASIHWHNFQKFVQNETMVKTAMASAVGGSYMALSGDAKAQVSNARQIRKITKVAMEKQIVRIWYRGEGGSMSASDLDRRLLDEVTKIIMAYQFKPVPSRWKPMEITEPEAKCEANAKAGRGGFFSGPSISASFCYARGTSYLYNSETSFESKAYVYKVTSEKIDNLPAAVGTSFGWMCRKYPNTFVNIQTGARGCPVKFPSSSDPNYRAETEPGTQPAKVVDDASAAPIDMGDDDPSDWNPGSIEFLDPSS